MFPIDLNVGTVKGRCYFRAGARTSAVSISPVLASVMAVSELGIWAGNQTVTAAFILTLNWEHYDRNVL